MTDREKLVEAFESALRCEMLSGDSWDVERTNRARAALLAAMEPVGEVYEVVDSHVYRDVEESSPWQRLHLQLVRRGRCEVPFAGHHVRVVKVAP